MKTIPIWGGRGNFPFLVAFAEVDDEHHLALSRFHWTLATNGYPKRREGDKIVYMHQDVAKLMLWPIKDGMEIDHEDRNKLNNQSSNLRVVSHNMNMANTDKKSHNTSGYKGVMWYVAGEKWHAQIGVNGKRVHLGYFDNKDEAARKVNAAYKYHYPGVAIPNPEVEHATDAPRIDHNDKAED